MKPYHTTSHCITSHHTISHHTSVHPHHTKAHHITLHHTPSHYTTLRHSKTYIRQHHETSNCIVWHQITQKHITSNDITKHRIQETVTMAKPTSAILRAGPSFVPSPVTATTSRLACSLLSMIPFTRTYLSLGEDLARTLSCGHNSSNFSWFIYNTKRTQKMMNRFRAIC